LKGNYTKEQAIMTLYRTYKFIENVKENDVNSTKKIDEVNNVGNDELKQIDQIY
jgi:hypothetical protein